jgi:two-component system, OmpR family, KDP operon response regulator KdpE
MTQDNPAIQQLDILIVEDDVMLNRVMTLQVRAIGYSFRSARSGLQALKMVEESIPSALILDLGLPDISGQEVIAALRENQATCSIPLIIHTTQELSDKERAELHLGPTKFVTKTTAFSELLAELISEVTAKQI